MLLKVIFGQRKERYEGEHAPEALDVMDEYSYEENPDWLNQKLETHRLNTDFERFEIIEIEVSIVDILNILRPNTNIQGKVMPPNGEN
jgi:hypothetical protein